MAARDTKENGLALAVFPGGVAAGAALLRRVPGVREQCRGPGCCCFLFQAAAEDDPARRQDAAAEPGFGARPVREVRPWLVRVGLRLRLADHALGAELLQHDHVVSDDEPRADLLRPVLSPAGDLGHGAAGAFAFTGFLVLASPSLLQGAGPGRHPPG